MEPYKMLFNTGDIFLCSGEGPMSKGIIAYNKFCGVRGEAAEISHVAMGATYQRVWESTTENDWAGKKGTQVNSYE
ncbi:unnamed protein product, partial [marine sediment metagenome]